MLKRTNVLLAICAVVVLQPLIPSASLAADEGKRPARQEGEDRWVPSLAILAGATIQKQYGTVDSVLFEDGSMTPVPLQGFFDGDDVAISPFVGGSLELMTPAIPIPTRPRLFMNGEILPTFASDRDIALDRDPDCIHGPRLNDPCVRDIVGIPTSTFDEGSAQGQGSATSARVDTLVIGASLGVAFPARIGKRQLRIKPYAAWINYEVDAEGIVVDAACNPPARCTDSSPSPPTIIPGFLRETVLTGNASQRFNGIGGGIDLEVDTGRFGPLGVSLFLGGRAYRVLGDRSFAFSNSATFMDELGNDTAAANWEVEVNPWMYRAHLGIRFQWLGSRD